MYRFAPLLLGPTLVIVSCSQPEQAPTNVPAADRDAEQTAENLEESPIASIDDQVAEGAKLFDENCDRCHGERGEGQEGVHSEAPQVLGDGVLATAGGERNFANAQQLYDYVSTQMPEGDEGSLDEDQYWAICAYMARANSADLTAPVGPSSASSIQLTVPNDEAYSANDL